MSKSEWVKKCGSVLKILKAHKHGWVFGEPVDPVKLQIPDYFDVIKQPMDLGTVKAKLDDGTLTSPEMFKEHVLLTFSNAMTYNPASHDVHIMAKTLKDLFLSKWEPMEGSVMEKWRMEQGGGGGGGQQSEGHGGKRVLESEFSDDRPMSYEEKRELSANMNKLPGKKLGNVVQIIHDRNHRILQPTSEDPDEIEIDIDKIDDATLRYLDKFVKEALAKKKKKTV
mmetsp:Transcript_37557/g.77085  ORF Transcript_37557/g.77085 Transcript_37557/m.77085 type:complete len:225 (-) Transcript_37557:404-1078(-)|eukprot:CAMPEP_0181308342 /NCGR_PEP_ID=MMETSP1101-20121128/11410_1 /TAXON_ID=46948 /ORGANISM="Rhodomonas abbreviata, Strain Caron Lab Isolate" /LENGTH=224 /DNA_ID=CAMNT_0023414715 /DNA_START=188 /DNA_END=862 /DNA_ORIENTATION=+